MRDLEAAEEPETASLVEGDLQAMIPDRQGTELSDGSTIHIPVEDLRSPWQKCRGQSSHPQPQPG